MFGEMFRKVKCIWKYGRKDPEDGINKSYND